MRLLIFIALAIFSIALLSGCPGSAPNMPAAEQAVNEAKLAGANTNCPEKYATAEAKLAQAKQAEEQKQWEAADNLATQAIEWANLAKDCPPPIAKVTEPVNFKKMKGPSSTLNPVYFDYDRYTIRQDQLPILNQNAQKIAKCTGALVEGHTDERGTSEYNLVLGERRAASVKKYMIQVGIDSNTLKITSRGEDMPAIDGHSEYAWSKNRRTEVKAYCQEDSSDQ